MTRFLTVIFLLAPFASEALSESIEDFIFVQSAEGERPYRGALDGLEDYLSDNPQVARQIAARGSVRIVVEETADELVLVKEVRKRVRKVFSDHGIKPRLLQRLTGWPEIVLLKYDLEEARQAAFDKLTEEAMSDGARLDQMIDRIQQRLDTPQIKPRVAGIFEKILITQAALLDRLMARGPLHALKQMGLAAAKFPFQALRKAGELGADLVRVTVAESYFLSSRLVANFRIPVRDLRLAEMAQGALAKSVPFIAAIRLYKDIYKDAPQAFWAATGLSFVLDTFHGIWASTWLDLQDDIRKIKGFEYQSKFNFYYGVFWGLCFRVIAYSSGVIPEGEWLAGLSGLKDGLISVWYLGSLYITGRIAARFGSRGYGGLNRLYETGALPKQGRDFIQQWVRDLFFCLAGALIGAGGETDPRYWMFLGLGFMVDEMLYSRGERSSQRPSITITNQMTMASGEFQYRFQNVVRQITEEQLLAYARERWPDSSEHEALEALKAESEAFKAQVWQSHQVVPEPDPDKVVDRRILEDLFIDPPRTLISPVLEVGKNCLAKFRGAS